MAARNGASVWSHLARRRTEGDETWVKTNMWRTLTFLAALRVDRIDAPLVLDGPINGRAFTAYVEQFLVPTLAPGDIVIMDNLGSHKGKAVASLVLFATPRHPRRRRQTAVPTALLA